ncbi:MAG TPA: hypothetical protein VLC30_18045 [Pseudomonas sp.]|nr:hypothetical protein [Pseudomonas sp.]
MQTQILGVVALLLAGAVQASSEQAWQAQDAELKARCLAASQLREAHVAGAPVLFDDSVGYTALLLSGRYVQPQMHGRMGRELCLYDRRSGQARIAEADALETWPAPE